MLRTLAFVAAAGMILFGPQFVFAHGEPIQGEVTITPGEPRVGEEARVVVKLRGGSTGVPLEGAQVKVIGEMTGHTMTPVEISLAEGDDSGQYSGLVTLTMAGPWNLRLQITHQGEHAEQVITTAVREKEVERDGSALTQSFSFLLEGDPPPYPLLILGMAATLIVGLMVMAIARRRSATASDVKRRDV